MQHLRSLTSRELLVPAFVGTIALILLVLAAVAPSRGGVVVEIPRPPADPWTARDQWVLLRGGEPAATTPMAPPSRAAGVRRRLLERFRRGGDVRVHRDRPDGWVPAAIVLHATGSGAPGSGFESLDDLHRYFARPSARSSAHFAVDRAGRVVQLVAEDDAAFHVATPGWNDVSIGIELLNDNSGVEPFSAVQLAALRELVRTLGERYDIPVEAVVRHRTVQPKDRSDPASNFPWPSWVDSLAPESSTRACACAWDRQTAGIAV